jgi:hypothetical protein
MATDMASYFVHQLKGPNPDAPDTAPPSGESGASSALKRRPPASEINTRAITACH